MLNGDIPELKSSSAQIRHRVKKSNIKYFGNMDPGDFGLTIVVPAAQQAEVVLEHTDWIPPGLIAGMLEALQKQLPRDKRIAAHLEKYKRLQAAVKSRGGESYLCCCCCCGPTARLCCPVGTSQQLITMYLCHCSFATSRQAQEAQSG
jgi:hypothetical protein